MANPYHDQANSPNRHIFHTKKSNPHNYCYSSHNAEFCSHCHSSLLHKTVQMFLYKFVPRNHEWSLSELLQNRIALPYKTELSAKSAIQSLPLQIPDTKSQYHPKDFQRVFHNHSPYRMFNFIFTYSYYRKPSKSSDLSGYHWLTALTFYQCLLVSVN